MRGLRNILSGRRGRWNRMLEASNFVFEKGVSLLPDDDEIRFIVMNALAGGSEMVSILVDQHRVPAATVLGARPFDIKRIQPGDLIYLQMRFLGYWAFDLQRMTRNHALDPIVSHLTGEVGSKLLEKMRQRAAPPSEDLDEILDPDPDIAAASLLWSDVVSTLKHPNGDSAERWPDPLVQILKDPEFAGFTDLLSRLMAYCKENFGSESQSDGD